MKENMSLETWLLIIILILQVVFIGLFVYFVVYPSIRIQENVDSARDNLTNMICNIFPGLPMCKKDEPGNGETVSDEST